MNVTFVTMRSPWPATRGDAMRLGGFMRALATRHEVACCIPRLQRDAAAQLRAWGVEPLKAGLRRVPRGLSPRLPLQMAPATLWCVPRVAVERSDVLHVSTVRSTPMLDEADLARVHLDFVDALSANALHRADTSHLGPLWRIEAERLRRVELELGATVASSSCTTEADRRTLAIPATNVIPFGVDLPTSVPPSASQPTILFPGNLGYFANVDAAVWLAEEILPLVRLAVPSARLLIVGARPTRQVRALDQAGSVEVHSDVSSMSPFYGAAWVVAAPLRYGTGLQTKVLESFAHGRAVVTTSSVASRVPGVVAGEHVEVGDDAPTLADLIVQILLDGPRRERVAVAGRAVARALTWEECGRRLERAYQR